MKSLTSAIASGVVAALLLGAAGLTPAAAEQDESLGGDATARFEESVKFYTAGDPQSVLDLATSGLEYASDGGLTDALSDPEAMMPDASGEFGLGVAGADDSHIVDGATVYTDVDADLDMVHQEFDDSERIISILGSDAAPTVQRYSLDLPESASMEMEEDGSISIYADVVHEIPVAGEEERIDYAVEQIMGADDLTFDDLDDLDDLTEEQIDALAAIPDPETTEVSTTELVGEVQAPWAVDANGNELETRFEIDGNVLSQEVSTTDSTAFPVVADPSIVWWIQKVTGCLVGVATIVAFGPAKVATVAAKVYKILKYGKTSKLKAAFSNWKYLSKNGKKPLSLIANNMKKFATDVKSTKGNFKKSWARMSGTKTGHQVKSLLINSGTTVIDLVGIRSCYDLYKQVR
ncbi:hypothetical protein [Leucobacter musarum]|uniref:hypothetical protein n=1 Tax=Leucobacter musarum TaxID=1930747 RepID=UPI0012E19399|nr:hypothetical protein [Leucobacter musarum]